MYYCPINVLIYSSLFSSVTVVEVLLLLFEFPENFASFYFNIYHAHEAQSQHRDTVTTSDENSIRPKRPQIKRHQNTTNIH